MPKIQVPELRNKYMDIVKDTDGLVSAAPSCVKALDKLGVDATEGSLKAAIQALEAQAKDVDKGLAKAGDKGAKGAKAFGNAINGLVADLKKISKGVAEIQAALS